MNVQCGGLMKIGKTIQLAFTIGCLITLTAGTCAWSATPAAAPAVTEASIAKDLALLENRFFSRQYASDPTDKRVERLELLVFGGVQDGDLSARWARLNKAIAARPAQAAKDAAPAGQKAGADGDKAGAAAGAGSGSSQYPVLNTLEWRALKKTFANESLDDRLGRLEKKLFGQDAPGMAYVDRVDRLKKTLGIGVAAAAPSGPLGPAPRARSRNLPDTSLDSFVSPFGGFGRRGGEQIYGDEGTYGSPDDRAFGGGLQMNPFTFGFGTPAINGAFNQLFADMQRQMSEINRLGPGTWTLDPKTGEWVEQESGRHVKPDAPTTPHVRPKFGGSVTPPKLRSTPILPTPKRQVFPYDFGGGSKNGDSALPPYADPNSI